MTLCMSWQARHDGAIPFFIRRFFRIAAMYYLSIPFFLWALMESVGVTSRWLQDYAEAFFALTAVTMATVTYLVIEEPCNRLGRYVARRVRQAGSEKFSATEFGPGPVLQEIAIGEK
jgi:peptidoglycan/LPS O-acetylase OafA/YrhL